MFLTGDVGMTSSSGIFMPVPMFGIDIGASTSYSLSYVFGYSYYESATRPLIKWISAPNATFGDFSFHTGLVSLYAPNITSTPGRYTFASCCNLVAVNLPKLSSYISAYFFHNCYNLVEVSLPMVTAVYGGSCFYNCYNLKSITLPRVTYLDTTSVFYSCRTLSYVAFKILSSIGAFAFSGLPYTSSISLSMYLGSTSVVAINVSAFSGGYISNLYIYVPSTLYKSYKSVYSSTSSIYYSRIFSYNE